MHEETINYSVSLAREKSFNVSTLKKKKKEKEISFRVPNFCSRKCLNLENFHHAFTMLEFLGVSIKKRLFF